MLSLNVLVDNKGIIVEVSFQVGVAGLFRNGPNK